MHHLRTTDMMKALPDATKAHLEATSEIVGNLAKKVAPEVDTTSSANTFFAKLLEAVSWFYSYLPADVKDNGKASMVHVAPGLKKAFADMEVRMKDNELKLTVTLADLDDFMVYKWLLKDAQRKVLSTWVKGVFARPGAKPAASASAASSSADSSATKAKKSQAAASSASLMAFFD